MKLYRFPPEREPEAPVSDTATPVVSVAPADQLRVAVLARGAGGDGLERAVEALGHVAIRAGDAAAALVALEGRSGVLLADSAGARALAEPLKRSRPAERPVVVVMAPSGSDAAEAAIGSVADDVIDEPPPEGELRLRLQLAAQRAARRRRRARADDELIQLRTAIGNTQLGVTVTDLDHRILYTNRAEAEMHGWTVEELLGRDARELAPAASRNRDHTPERLSSFRRWKRESVNTRRDGSTFPVQITSDVVTDAAGHPIWVVSCCEDISARKQVELELRSREERYALAARGSNDGLWDWDLEQDRIFFSERWCSILGFRHDQLGDAPAEWLDRIHPADRDRLRTVMDRHLAGGSDHFECSHRVLHSDGRYRWVLARGIAVRTTDGRAVRLAGSLTDLTERGVHDELTGLPNRTLFADRLPLAEARRRRDGRGYAVMLIDLDRFKLVNAGLSFAFGDRLLAEVARRLERQVRATDSVARADSTLARAGSDEFLLLLEALAEPEDAIRVASRIQAGLQEPFLIDGREVFTSASVGIAYCGDGPSSQDLVRDAGIALHRAKAGGKGRIEVFDPAMQERANARLQLESDLRHAVERNELLAVYQPILDLSGGQLAGCEALVRWQHPVRGMISPAEFVPAAEESGLILGVDSWVLEEACRQLARWDEAHGGGDLTVNVNLSSRHFARADVVDRIRESLERSGCPGHRLKLEITESSLMENPEVAARALDALKELGIRICVDDFGTGYSSLSYLQRFPIDVIKIDRAFAAALDGGGKEAAIVEAIVSLAGHLNMQVVAEGIETVEQLERLRRMGCGQGQGYLFSRPCNPADAGEWFTPNPSWAKTFSPRG